MAAAAARKLWGAEGGKGGGVMEDELEKKLEAEGEGFNREIRSYGAKMKSRLHLSGRIGECSLSASGQRREAGAR